MTPAIRGGVRRCGRSADRVPRAGCRGPGAAGQVRPRGGPPQGSRSCGHPRGPDGDRRSRPRRERRSPASTKTRAFVDWSRGRNGGPSCRIRWHRGLRPRRPSVLIWFAVSLSGFAAPCGVVVSLSASPYRRIARRLSGGPPAGRGEPGGLAAVPRAAARVWILERAACATLRRHFGGLTCTERCVSRLRAD